ncbi:MAG: hypothetical protein RI897_639 [Verrucomicrobiota bacterium]
MLCSGRLDFLLSGWAEPVEVFELHGHPLIGAEAVAVLQEEIPVERGERTGFGAGRGGGVVRATSAVVAHALDIFAGGHIGFGGHDASVRELRHSDRIGEFDPFHGIDIDGEVPFVDGLRFHTEHEGVEPGDHEALDVMRIAEAQGLADGILQAGHAGVSCPKECW